MVGYWSGVRAKSPRGGGERLPCRDFLGPFAKPPGISFSEHLASGIKGFRKLARAIGNDEAPGLFTEGF